jgi:hypothetical protein
VDPPVPARVVKKPVRKQAIAHRAPAAASLSAAKPAPAPRLRVRRPVDRKRVRRKCRRSDGRAGAIPFQ